MKKKLSIGVMFGGRSGEHEVSLVSAASVMASLNKEKYEIVPIGITKDGRWFSGPKIIDTLKKGRVPKDEEEAVILPEPTKKGLHFLKGGKFVDLDVVFPVLHGTFGEDGSIQGLFDMAGIPYVGAGVLGSSVGMDKIIQKEIVEREGINVVPFIWFLNKLFDTQSEIIIKNIEQHLSYPCFVKPANSGSSVGISKAHDRLELKNAIKEAARYDRRTIVEKGIEGAREIEVAILGNDEVTASCPGEIVPSNEFYDYDAKYVDGSSKTVIPADLPERSIKRVQEMAIHAYRAIDCAGMARVDFLVTESQIYLNELNTIPGFTSISMYPKLWEASGIPYPELLDRLVRLALERSDERSGLLTTYQPKKEWYK